MALMDDGLKGSVPSILVVLGVAMAAPIVLPAVASVSRPLAKTLIKGYLVLADTIKEFAAEAGEQVSDLVAEVKAERSAAGEAEAAATTAAKATKAKSTV
jgi:hypothetical protein